MTYLLDVSVLLAWLWKDHEHHGRVIGWQMGRAVATCPLTELGFLRISTQPVFGATMKEAREMLSVWIQKSKASRLPCDLAALEGIPAPTGTKTTDYYLANVAQEHGCRLVTLDESIKHPAAFVIPK